MKNGTRSCGALWCLPVLLTLAGCSNLSWPWSRNHDSTAAVAPATGDDAECDRLRSAIKDNEERRRDASADSTSPEIVAAAEAKAGQKIDELRTRYEALDCPGEADPRYRRAPVAPAPGASPP